MKTSLEDRVRAYASQLDQIPAHRHTPYESFANAATEPTKPTRRKAVPVSLLAVLGLSITLVARLNRPENTRTVVVARSAEAQANNGLVSTRLSFPVVGPATYADTLGAPRNGVDGTKIQEGLDLFAPAGTKVVALRAGRVERMSFESSGTSLVLMDADGNRYVYRRLRNPPEHVKPGAVIPSGGLIGRFRRRPRRISKLPRTFISRSWTPPEPN